MNPALTPETGQRHLLLHRDEVNQQLTQAHRFRHDLPFRYRFPYIFR